MLAWIAQVMPSRGGHNDPRTSRRRMPREPSCGGAPWETRSVGCRGGHHRFEWVGCIDAATASLGHGLVPHRCRTTLVRRTSAEGTGTEWPSGPLSLLRWSFSNDPRSWRGRSSRALTVWHRARAPADFMVSTQAPTCAARTTSAAESGVRPRNSWFQYSSCVGGAIASSTTRIAPSCPISR